MPDIVSPRRRTSHLTLLVVMGLAALALSACPGVAPGWDPNCKKPSPNHLCCLDPPTSTDATCTSCAPTDYACILCNGPQKGTDFCAHQSQPEIYCADGAHENTPPCQAYRGCLGDKADSLSCQPGGWTEYKKLLDTLFCVAFTVFEIGGPDGHDACHGELDTAAPRSAASERWVRLELERAPALEVATDPALERWLRVPGPHALLLERGSGKVLGATDQEVEALQEGANAISWQGKVSLALTREASPAWHAAGRLGSGLSLSLEPEFTVRLEAPAVGDWLRRGGDLYVAIEAPGGRIFALDREQYAALALDATWSGSTDVLVVESAGRYGITLGALASPEALDLFGGGF